MTATTNIEVAAETWTECSDGHANVSVQASKLGVGHLAVTDTGSAPVDEPNMKAKPFHPIINTTPGIFGNLLTGDKVWVWLPQDQTVAVTRG